MYKLKWNTYDISENLEISDKHDSNWKQLYDSWELATVYPNNFFPLCASNVLARNMSQSWVTTKILGDAMTSLQSEKLEFSSDLFDRDILADWEMINYRYAKRLLSS